MPGIVKVKVIEGRNLPVMDRSADTTDAYVELKLGNITYKTEVCRKSLNPQWHSEWYKFEMDDAELQDEPLQVRLMDHDTYSANDMIGKVYFNLNPLLLNSATETLSSGCISGWFPVYDTIHGLRGEVNLIIKLELFSDFNKFRQSSCGVHIFSCSSIPYGYYTENIYGFVEELVVEDDPEYQWIEKIRTPRASNEARQAMFYKMSGELQRKIGLKVIEMGGNAVIGYRQCYDLEGESGGVVIRGIGTAVKLIKQKKQENMARPSLFNSLFKIPDLTVTPILGFGDSVSFDGSSVRSLTDSLQSENLFGDLVPEDRWSLCSFASRTSCNSRYTSIETLLDQTNRKPVKTGSKLLSVARYFTSKRIKRKFSLKKKQKSILLRKFSVIEEYKQKGNRNSPSFDVDDTVQQSTSSPCKIDFKENNMERIPIVEEKVSCQLFDDSQQLMYFNMTEYLNGKNKEDLIFDFENDPINILESKNEELNLETREVRNVKNTLREIENCIISDNINSSQLQKRDSVDTENSKTNEFCKFNETSTEISGNLVDSSCDLLTPLVSSGISNMLSETKDSSVRNNCDRRSQSSENVHRIMKDSGTQYLREIEDSFRCMTPPISEMMPYSVSPPTSNAVIMPCEDRIREKKFKFETEFLRSLRRNYVTDYFSISESPEVRKLSLLSENRENDSLKSYDNGTESVIATATDNCEAINSVSRDVTNAVECEQSIRTHSLENTSSTSSTQTNNSKPFSLSEPEFASNTRNLSTASIVTPDNISFPSYSSMNNTALDCTNNINNHCDVEITTADDNSNILREALTPSRLLMHANNLNRNTSESEKDEDEALKRETATSSDPIIKTRTLSESGNTAKCSECPKETVSSQENESVVANAIDCGGYNIIHKENIEMMEYPFLTLTTYPEDFIIHLGGTVSARSVKLLARISNIEEPETRDAWWTELRVEIKSHMRALACNAVLNYVENTSICDEVCVLNASGTAAVVRVYENIGTYTSEDTTKNVFNKNADFEQEMKTDKLTPEETLPNVNCSIFHIPYRKSSLPFPVRIKTCELCKRGFVADVIFVTIEPPDRTPIIGQSAFVHAFVYRLKRDCKSELNAREISDGLPFLEYDLNRQLLNKLKIKGMNAIFGLNIQVAIGEKMISAHATGTAVLLSALPSPPELTLVAHGKWQHPASKKRLNDARKLLEDATRKNKIHYQLVETSSISDLPRTSAPMAAVESTVLEPNADLEYCAGFKHTCVIEVDDEDDLDAVQLLIDPNPPQGFLVSATEKIIFGSLPYVPKKNIQLFAQVYRYRIPINTPPSGFNKLFFRIVQALYVKIHNRIPCSLNKVSFKMDIPEPDELQIRVVGMALALKESERVLESVSTSCSSVSELADDFILNIDSEKDGDSDTLSNLTPRKQIIKKKTDTKDSEIQITSLSYIPGANISFYLGNLNFVFIRESTMVKEQTGGVNNFVNNLLSDVTTIVKSHAAGIGGNAVVNFFLNECLLITHSHKNQGQCLINVGGDVVRYVPRNTKYQNQSTTFNV